MTDLTKRESAYFIGFAIVALTILLGTLWMWANQAPTCWELYASEQQAIEHCEQ